MFSSCKVGRVLGRHATVNASAAAFADESQKQELPLPGATLLHSNVWRDEGVRRTVAELLRHLTSLNKLHL